MNAKNQTNVNSPEEESKDGVESIYYLSLNIFQDSLRISLQEVQLTVSPHAEAS